MFNIVPLNGNIEYEQNPSIVNDGIRWCFFFLLFFSVFGWCNWHLIMTLLHFLSLRRENEPITTKKRYRCMTTPLLVSLSFFFCIRQYVRWISIFSLYSVCKKKNEKKKNYRKFHQKQWLYTNDNNFPIFRSTRSTHTSQEIIKIDTRK